MIPSVSPVADTYLQNLTHSTRILSSPERQLATSLA